MGSMRLWPSRTPPPPTAADRVEQRSSSVALSIGDPAFAEYFGLGNPNYSGVTVTESTALAISAVWRAVSLIAGTIASLPATAVETGPDGTSVKVPSWADNPAGPDGLTRYEFWETVLLHLLVHGNAYCLHLRNGAGAMVGLIPVHPMAVQIEIDPTTAYKSYLVSMIDGTQKRLDSNTLLHIPALSSDGIRGLSPIEVARSSFGTTIAGDRAAANMFNNGALISGFVSPDEDMEESDAAVIRQGLDRSMLGYENAGTVAVVNRKLNFTPWTMSHEDAQFLQSRQFQIEEIARWYGVPPYELMQTEKQTSWGTGIEAQQRGLGRQVIHPWVQRIEQRVSRLMPNGRELKFDFHELERPTPEQEVALLAQQVQAGIMTVNEARAVRNLPPIEGGDQLGSRQPVTTEVGQ